MLIYVESKAFPVSTRACLGKKSIRPRADGPMSKETIPISEESITPIFIEVCIFSTMIETLSPQWYIGSDRFEGLNLT